MNALDDQKETILAAFINPKDGLDDAIHSYVKVVGADACLRLAAMAGQPAIMRTLIVGHGANIYQTRKESSDRKNGIIERNLIDDVVDSLLYRKDIDRSKAGRQNFYNAVNFLVEQNVGVRINADPMESPMMGAHLLAFPQKAQERDMPHYDLVVGTVLEDKPEAFKQIYAFFLGRFPEDVKTFEHAVEDEKARLRGHFAAARNAERAEEELTSPKPRSVGNAATGLVFSTLRKD